MSEADRTLLWPLRLGMGWSSALKLVFYSFRADPLAILASLFIMLTFGVYAWLDGIRSARLGFGRGLTLLDLEASRIFSKVVIWDRFFMVWRMGLWLVVWATRS